VNWPQYGFDPGHSAYNPNETTIGVSNVSQLQQAWSFSTGSGNNAGNVVEANGVVYAPSTNGTLYALNAANGTSIWSFASGSGYASSGSAPVYDNGMVFTVCNTSSSTQGICALNATSGTPAWTYTFPGSSAYAGTPPVVSNGMLFFEGCNTSCSYVALNESTGSVVWAKAEPETNCEGNNGVTPAVAYGFLYVGYACAPSGGTIAALRITNGHTKWQGSGGGQNAGLSVSSGMLVLMLFLADGSRSIEGPGATHAKTGNGGWESAAFYTSTIVLSMPAITPKVTFVTALGYIEALKTKQQGKFLWSNYPKTPNMSSPSVANGVVYTACAGSPCAYSTTSPTLLWSGPGAATSGVPIIVNGVVYGACNGSNVCAWALPSEIRRKR